MKRFIMSDEHHTRRMHRGDWEQECRICHIAFRTGDDIASKRIGSRNVFFHYKCYEILYRNANYELVYRDSNGAEVSVGQKPKSSQTLSSD